MQFIYTALDAFVHLHQPCAAQRYYCFKLMLHEMTEPAYVLRFLPYLLYTSE